MLTRLPREAAGFPGRREAAAILRSTIPCTGYRSPRFGMATNDGSDSQTRAMGGRGVVQQSLWDKLNATLVAREDISPGLGVFRIETDGERFSFTAGQYCALGLPPDAPRVPEAEPEKPLDEKERSRLIRRSYSIASAPEDEGYLDFYLALVPEGVLTPRVFAMGVGDRIWVGPKATGLFTLAGVPAGADVFLLCTGTGLAPFMSMLKSDLLAPGRVERVVLAHGVRYVEDLGYRAEVERIAAENPRLRYVPSVTRRTEESGWTGAKGHMQEQLVSGDLTERSGVPLDPENAHVFLCGNPAMIEEAVELLTDRGFSEWSKKNPGGNIHLEKYW